MADEAPIKLDEARIREMRERSVQRTKEELPELEPGGGSNTFVQWVLLHQMDSRDNPNLITEIDWHAEGYKFQSFAMGLRRALVALTTSDGSPLESEIKVSAKAKSQIIRLVNRTPEQRADWIAGRGERQQRALENAVVAKKTRKSNAKKAAKASSKDE